MELFKNNDIDNITAKIGHKKIYKKDWPEGIYMPYDGREPFVPPMKECNSIELNSDDIVVDIGAYAGTYSVKAARSGVRKVIAYEPTPYIFKILRMNLEPNMEIYEQAVSNEFCKKTFYLSKGIGVTNSLVPSNSKIPITVDCLPYSYAIQNATVVKIDIEGGEYYIDDLIQDHVRAYIIDFHKAPKWISKAEAIIGQLIDKGYKEVISPDWSNGWTQAGSWKKS